MIKKIFFWKKCFIRSEKARGPAGDRGKKIEKFRKFLARRITGPAGPDRPGPARPGIRNFRFTGPIKPSHHDGPTIGL